MENAILTPGRLVRLEVPTFSGVISYEGYFQAVINQNGLLFFVLQKDRGLDADRFIYVNAGLVAAAEVIVPLSTLAPQ